MVDLSRLKKKIRPYYKNSLSSQITSLRPIEFCDKEQKSLQEFDQNISPTEFIVLRMREASLHTSVDVNNVIFIIVFVPCT